MSQFTVLALAMALLGMPAARAQEIPPPDASLLMEPRTIQFEVFINGHAHKEPAEFIYDPKSERLSARRQSLDAIGLKLPESGKPEDVVVLEDLGIDYKLDHENSRLDMALSDDQRVTRTYDGRGDRKRPEATSDWGALVNYDLFGAYFKDDKDWDFSFSGANLTLDARVFTPLGVFTQTGIVGMRYGGWEEFRQSDVTRLDTTFSYANPDGPSMYRAGDAISGSLPWTRPIRIGGIQIQRDWALRSDIVTAPLPFLVGSAAVPSTVDIYVNGSRRYSHEVDSGPFRLDNIPVTGSGDARVVVRDVTGKEVEGTLPLFATNRMLAPGLWDYSFEMGFARRGYGVAGGDYHGKPVGLGSVRYGLTQSVTLEGHAEGGAGLVNGGLGALMSTSRFGQVTASVSGSHFSGFGAQASATWEIMLPYSVRLSLGTQRTFGNFEDLASVSALWQGSGCKPNGQTCLSGTSHGAIYDPRPPKAVDRVALSMPIPFDDSSLSVGFVQVQQANGETSRIVTGTYSRKLPWEGSLYASVFSDFGDRRTTGAYVGMSIPLGERTRASVSGVQNRDATRELFVEASRTIRDEDGDYGWRVRSSLREERQSVEASGAYRSSYGRVGATARTDGSAISGSAEMKGAIALMGGGVLVGNTVTDGFAVVDVGAPGVKVLNNDRLIGATDLRGRLMVPNLRAYEENKISVDPADLPLETEIAETEKIVVPRWRSGVIARFGVSIGTKAATVVLSDTDGNPLPVGSTGVIEGGSEEFVVGYDGRAYVRELTENNTVVISMGENKCRASFPYPDGATQGVEIKAVCQ